MIQYGLKFQSGWLPRDAQKRWLVFGGHMEPHKEPDLWWDKERVEELSRKYHCQIVIFKVDKVDPAEMLL